MRSTWTIRLAIVSFAVLFAVACGPENGGENGSGGDTGVDEADGGNGVAEQFEEVDCSEATSAAEVQVGPNFVFEPSNMTIGAGDVVQWTWASGVTQNHDVVADDDADCADAKPSWFQSERSRESGHTYCVRFEEPGDWNYQCTVTGHCPAGMKGTVTVESQ